MRASFLFFLLFVMCVGRAQAADSAGGDAKTTFNTDAITAKAEAIANEYAYRERYSLDRPARAELPHAFKNGTPATAEEVNANFEALQSAINDLDVIDSWLFNVDCGSDPAALQSKLETTTGPSHFYRYYLIKGKCEVGLLFVGSSNIFVVGADEKAAIVPDASTVQFFGFPLLFWDVGAGGQLVIAGVTLGSHLFTAYYNGTIRLGDVTFAADSVYSFVEARRGSHLSLFGALAYPEGSATMGIVLRTGASGRFDAAGLKADVTMTAGASAECTGCSDFEQLTLNIAANSSFQARWTDGTHVPISSLKLRHNSTFVQYSGPCSSPPYALEKDETSVADFCFYP